MKVAKGNFICEFSQECFKGYSKENEVRPYFGRVVAEKILRFTEAWNFQWEYDVTQDTFFVWLTENPDEVFSYPAVYITIPGLEIEGYQIGDGFWVWDRC